MTITKTQRTLFVAGWLFAIVLITGGVLAFGGKGEQTTSMQNTSTTATTNTSTPTTTVADSGPSQYKDGTYKATGSYSSPGGTDSIEVSLTLKSDVVTAATVKGDSVGDVSSVYQGDFIDGYKPMVIGKKISSIKLGQVSGSSLTSIGFNSALAAIETQAKA